MFLILLLSPVAAFAHPGHGVEGFHQGFFHPLLGFDHLIAALTVGVWSAQSGTRERFILPPMFLLFMLTGGAMGMAGFSLPNVEAGIWASLILLSVAVAMSVKVRLGWSLSMISIFGLFHGNAHGLEIAPGLDAVGYATGFLIATASLHLAGILVARVLLLDESAGVRRPRLPAHDL